MIDGKLAYDCALNRWQLVDAIDQRTWELHCGDTFQLQIEKHWFDVRIEHGDKGYYLIPAGLALCVGLRARSYT